MVEEILPNIFRIIVPLPNGAIKTLNSYVIISEDRNLIIDTGWNRPECAKVLLDGLGNIGVNLSRTDLFLTHIHADHAGLIDLFKSSGTSIYCGHHDLEFMDRYINISSEKDWRSLKALAQYHGFLTEEITMAIESHPGNRYAPDYVNNIIPVKDNSKIIIGNCNLHCVATPGHTLGHMCLYEPMSKILFSGDHLLGAFSPIISQWNLEDRCVTDYLESLDKLAGYDVRIVLPGHLDSFTNFQVRIEEAKVYQQIRNSEILELFKNEEIMTAYQVASRRSWGKGVREWSSIPVFRRWTAVADTLAQLCYLRDKGILHMQINQHHVTWGFANN